MKMTLCAALIAGIPAQDSKAEEVDAMKVLTSVKWIKQKGEPVVVNPYGDTLNAVIFTPDGKQIVADTDKTLYFFDRSIKKSAESIEGYREMLDRTVFSPDAKRAYLVSWGTISTTVKGVRKMVQGGELTESDWKTKKKVKLVTLKKEVESYAVSADGKRIALGFGDGSFQIVAAGTGKSLLGPVTAYKGITIENNTFAGVTAIAFSADGKRLALGGVDTLLRFYDSSTGKQLGSPVAGHTSLIEAIAFSPDGRHIVTATQDMGLFLLDGATGKVIGDRLDTGNKVTALAFSPDGKQVVTGHFRGDLSLWNFTPTN